MALAFKIKKGDTLPILAAVLKDGAGDPLNVSTATVTFRMRKDDATPGTRKVNREVDFTTDGSDGAVEIQLTAEESGQVGQFLGEFLVDFGGGDVQTIPSDDFVRVTITDVI